MPGWIKALEPRRAAGREQRRASPGVKRPAGSDGRNPLMAPCFPSGQTPTHGRNRVIGTEDNYVMELVVTLPLKVAETIVDTAIRTRREEKMLPLTVAVLDAGGNLVALKREDGCGILRADIAIGKAWGALGMGVSSRAIRDRLSDRPSFQAALSAVSEGRFVPVPGGVLVRNAEDQVIGAVGISGDASDKDEYCAIAGVHEAGFRSHPENPDDHWRGADL